VCADCFVKGSNILAAKDRRSTGRSIRAVHRRAAGRPAAVSAFVVPEKKMHAVD